MLNSIFNYICILLLVLIEIENIRAYYILVDKNPNEEELLKILNRYKKPIKQLRNKYPKHDIELDLNDEKYEHNEKNPKIKRIGFNIGRIDGSGKGSGNEQGNDPGNNPGNGPDNNSVNDQTKQVIEKMKSKELVYKEREISNLEARLKKSLDEIKSQTKNKRDSEAEDPVVHQDKSKKLKFLLHLVGKGKKADRDLKLDKDKKYHWYTVKIPSQDLLRK